VGRVTGLDHVQVAAPPGCETEARRFYGELLGLEEIEKPAELRARGGVWFRCGEQQIHVGVDRERFTPASKAHPALAAAGVDDLAASLERGGAPVTWDDAIAGTRRLFTADPWGNRIELLEAATSDR
jgi:catechol 2,3-dioxygenase-like lactoylglutathione lyase family enzyme